MKSHFSMRLALSLLAFLLLLIAGGILFLIMQNNIDKATESAYDRLLLASAQIIANAVQTENNNIAVEIPSAAFSMFSNQDRVFYVIRNAVGVYVTGYEKLDPNLQLATTTTAKFDTFNYQGETIRMVTMGRLIAYNEATALVTIRVAQTRHEQTNLKNNIISHELFAIFAFMIVSLAIIWFGISMTFLPLKKLENELRLRNLSDLSPLESPAPHEINMLVIALNLFMARLENASQRMRDLVADAAHQIRTPLASLRSQIEVAIHEKDAEKQKQRLLKIQKSAIQASQLVSQLLMDATIAHRLQHNSDKEVDVDILIDDVVNRLDPNERERLTIKMNPQTRNILLKGDRVALREMLRNLIDNALRYSHDDVYLTIDCNELWLIINIIDQGQGIDNTEKSLVVQRFKRGSNAGQSVGSGLGLPIALQVAVAHGGTLTLFDAIEEADARISAGEIKNKGLRVELCLPIYKTASKS